jgi:hypothetical protein
MGIVAGLIATEKTSSVAPSSDLRHGDHLLALGELVLAAPQALPGLTVPGHQPHVTASLVLMRIRVSIRGRRRTVSPSRSSGGSAFRKVVGLRNSAMRCCLRVSVLRRTGVTRPLCTVTRSGVAGDHPGARSCVAGLPVTVGSEPRSDAIGIGEPGWLGFIRRLEENTPRPTNGHP